MQRIYLWDFFLACCCTYFSTEFKGNVVDAEQNLTVVVYIVYCILVRASFLLCCF